MNSLDTKIIRQPLLEGKEVASVRRFFQRTSSAEILVSDLSSHSLGIFSLRIKMWGVLARFINDTIILGGIQAKGLNPLFSCWALRAEEAPPTSQRLV